MKTALGDDCCDCPAFASSKALRSFFCCARVAECAACTPGNKCCIETCSRYYDADCMVRSCVSCKGNIQKLTCQKCRDAVPEIKHQEWSDGVYKCKDGREKKTWDFNAKESSIDEFLDSLDNYLPEFLPHHNRAKFLDDDWKKLFDNVSANGTKSNRIALVIDYANSYTHEHRDEHYQEFWNQLSTTILGCVVKISVANLNDEFIKAQGFTRDSLLALLKVSFPSIYPSICTDVSLSRPSF